MAVLYIGQKWVIIVGSFVVSFISVTVGMYFKVGFKVLKIKVRVKG